jgi:hypothetical protein
MKEEDEEKTVQNGVGNQMIDRQMMDAQSGEDRDRSWVLAGCER